MSDRLQEIIQKIRDNISTIASANEMAVRQGAILPILAELGWDVWNTEEIIPEYTIGQSRVDYCLAIRGQNKIFIETKAGREELDGHREQLFNYAFHSGVPFAVLTNGIRWSFYLVLVEGNWGKRRFVEIDIEKESSVEVKRKLETFLSRSGVASGTAAAEATKLYEGAAKADAIERALPKAWNRIIQAPDELLVELLLEKVEEICHHRPEKRRVEDFVLHLPPFSTQESDEPKRTPKGEKPQVISGNVSSFPVSVPRAFIDYGAFSVKSQYRPLLPANQEGLAPEDRTYFAVEFPGYGDAQAYMSQGRLKIRDKNIWREIVTKLGITADDTFVVEIIKPSLRYQVTKK